MKTFEYSFLSKFIYRYGNIPINIVLLFYFIGAALSLNKHLMFLIPLAITLLLLFLLNRQYFKMYKFMPYKISVDNEKMICENFLFSAKKIEIKFKDITKLSGGIFDGRISGMHFVHDGINNVKIGFFDKMQNARALQTHILHLVDRKVYDEVVEKMSVRKKQVETRIKKAAQKKGPKKHNRKNKNSDSK